MTTRLILCAVAFGLLGCGTATDSPSVVAGFGEACKAGADCESTMCANDRCAGETELPIQVSWQRSDPPPEPLTVAVFRAQDIPEFQRGRGLEPQLAILSQRVEQPFEYPFRLVFQGLGAAELQVVAYVPDASRPGILWFGRSTVIVTPYGTLTNEADETTEQVSVLMTGITSLEGDSE